jgi:hypothetical protein
MEEGPKKFWQCEVCNDVHWGENYPEHCPNCDSLDSYVEITKEDAVDAFETYEEEYEEDFADIEEDFEEELGA